VPERQRFEARVDGELGGIAQYLRRPGRVIFTHTEVLPASGGRGVGSSLAKGALHYRMADGTGEPAELPTVLDVRPDGAIWIRGDLRLEVDGTLRSERRAALCGCGRTGARPYCDAACVRPPAWAPAGPPAG